MDLCACMLHMSPLMWCCLVLRQGFINEIKDEIVALSNVNPASSHFPHFCDLRFVCSFSFLRKLELFVRMCLLHVNNSLMQKAKGAWPAWTTITSRTHVWNHRSLQIELKISDYCFFFNLFFFCSLIYTCNTIFTNKDTTE